jgi:hypothetical protein
MGERKSIVEWTGVSGGVSETSGKKIFFCVMHQLFYMCVSSCINFFLCHASTFLQNCVLFLP